MVASVIAAMLMGQPAYGGHVVQPTTPDGGVHLVTPTIGGERGKEVFVSKVGCIACHANGVGGHDAPKLDGRTMQGLMNSFDFRGEDVKPRADDDPGVGGRARRADYAHRPGPGRSGRLRPQRGGAGYVDRGDLTPEARADDGS